MSVYRDRTLIGVVAFVLVLVASMAMTMGTARGQVVPLSGDAAAPSGGVARTVFIGDLKRFPSGTKAHGPCGSEFQGFVVCEGDYNDDNAGDSRFRVTPNPGDEPLQEAWQVVVFDFRDQTTSPPGISATNDIEAIEHEIYWVAPYPTTDGPAPDQNPPQRVFHRVVEARLPSGDIDPNVILTGSSCNVLGNYGTNGTIADGLVQTGQAGSSLMQAAINACIQGEIGFHLIGWGVSKHLPPGTYEQVVTLVHSSGAETDPVSVEFVIEPLSHYQIDFAQSGVDWGALRRADHSVHGGDWNLSTPARPTIQGDGNTSLVLRLRYAPLVHDGKLIWSEFDAQVSRRNMAGQLIEWEYAGGLQSGQSAGVFGPWQSFAGPTSTSPGVPPSGAVCLEPNEPLKVDFGVTPQQTVFSGTYTGILEVGASVDPAACTPSFDQGESDTGDPNPYDNNPSQGGPDQPPEAPPTPSP